MSHVPPGLLQAFVEGMLPGQQEREHTAARLKRVEKLAKRWGLPLVGCASSLLRGGANAQARIKSASANQSRRAELTQHADALRARLVRVGSWMEGDGKWVEVGVRGSTVLPVRPPFSVNYFMFW